jgi:CheY-like chemotaxis protein
MSTSDFEFRLQLLRERYANSLGQKRAALALAWQAFAADPRDAALRRELSMQLHRLCGSAGAYGYDDIGGCACSADRLVGEHGGIVEFDAAQLRRCGDEVEAVLAALDRATSNASQAPPPGLRVLLVEDDPAQAALTAAWLQARGASVHVESHADALGQRLAEWPCEVVVLDHWLRGETAIEVVAALRRTPRHARIAVVCFSVERNAQVRRALLQAGCDAVVAKDDGHEALWSAIRQCAARPDRSGRGRDEPA